MTAETDAWQGRFHTTVYNFGLTLAELHKSNPWPENSALDEAMATLATELWDRFFSQTEIRQAYEEALRRLPNYAAGEEVRR